MRTSRYLFALAGAVLLTAGARAADPVVVELTARVTVGTTLITVGDVALVSGGDADLRARVARLDLADFKPREASIAIGRRSLEYRLQLAGIDAARVGGADRVTVTPVRRPVAVEEVVAAARAELLRQVADTPALTVELAQPLVVKLPEVMANERVTITGKPRTKPGAAGRVQMDMTLACGGETLLAFAIQLDVKTAPAVARAGGPVPNAAVLPAGATAPNEVLVRARQRVEVTIQSGELKVAMAGEAQQDGRLGQTIMVQNPDSKKLVPAKVVGAGKLEVELGGTTP